MQKTNIQYLSHTWNPIKMRCTPVSEGCRSCWAIAMAKRLTKNPLIPEDHRKAYEGGPPVLDIKELEAPLHLKKPDRIGLQFMGDWMHEDIPNRWIDLILEVIAACHQHTFFTLTKRPQNLDSKLYRVTGENPCRELGGGDYLPNLWLGVSVEDQKTADERIPMLLQIPAAHRWVSIEPMLESVDILPYLGPERSGNELWAARNNTYPPFLDWVTCGGETGPKARPMHPDWVRNIRDQCQAAGVQFFFKNWGKWLPVGQKPAGEFKPIGKHDALKRFHLWEDSDKNVSMKIGHKAVGSLLDGKVWDEIPK